MRTSAKIISATLTVAAALVAALMALSGSSDLEVGQITPEFPTYPSGALPYALPLKRLVVSTKTRIVDCKNTQQGEELHATTTLEVQDRIEVDESQQYYIYYRSKSRGKSLNYSLEAYANGSLKSFSGTIRDEIAPLTEALASSLVPLIKSGVMAGASPSPTPPPLQANCRELTAAIARNDPTLLLVGETIWTPAPEFTGLEVGIPLRALADRFALVHPYWSRSQALLSLQVHQLPASQDVTFTDAVSAGNDGALNIPPLARGLILRNPVQATLTMSVCDAACSKLSGGATGTVDGLSTLPSVMTMLPQFGKRFLVALHGGYAQTATLDVDLTAEGAVSKIHTTTQSSLVQNAKTLADTAAGTAP